MRFKSIRSRLAFNFAGIALLVAIVLGAVLLPVLRNYYANLELNYLKGNATVIGNYISATMADHVAHNLVQSQIDNLSFLSQTRIQVYDADGQLQYDSGSPQDLGVNLGLPNQIVAEAQPGGSGNSQGNISVFPVPSNGQPPAQTGTATSFPQPGNEIFIYHSSQSGASPFALFLNGQPLLGNTRSTQSVTDKMLDPQNSNVLATVKLSEGPAYGSAILASVARVWALASLVALLLAAGVGWWISRRISAPVLALTKTTTQMAQGDLSSRAGIQTRDELGQLAHVFNDMADQVEGTVLTLRTFVSDAAHEINSPLTALKTNLELALNEQNLSQREAFIRNALAQNERLENLANELLDLSRLEAGRSEHDFETFDLHVLVAGLAERYASRAEQTGQIFNLVLPERELPVRGNPAQIQRALENLLENALKFTPPEGTVTVEVQSNLAEITIVIRDSGIGILPEDLPQLFKRFHRGQNASAFSGNGLGLAIVKAIADNHGGTVEVHSDGPGQGSQFTFRLPNKAPDSGESEKH